jgi:hypothetical protein
VPLRLLPKLLPLPKQVLLRLLLPKPLRLLQKNKIILCKILSAPIKLGAFFINTSGKLLTANFNYLCPLKNILWEWIEIR